MRGEQQVARLLGTSPDPPTSYRHESGFVIASTGMPAAGEARPLTAPCALLVASRLPSPTSLRHALIAGDVFRPSPHTAGGSGSGGEDEARRVRETPTASADPRRWPRILKPPKRTERLAERCLDSTSSIVPLLARPRSATPPARRRARTCRPACHLGVDIGHRRFVALVQRQIAIDRRDVAFHE